jgi:hypothetical protein
VDAEEEVAMRGLRVVVVVASVGAMVWGATSAAADGGAFIEFQKTYYLPGQTAVATSSVLIPKANRDILDRGPFYAFVVPGGASLREGRAIADTAVRLGVLAIRPRNHDTKLDLTFTMPELPDGNYTVQVCNDPCTISGFRTPLTGFFSIVHTARERRLLIKEQHLRGRIWHLKRELKKTTRGSAAAAQDLDSMRAQRDVLAAENGRLRTQVAALSTEGGSVWPWAGLWAGLAIIAGLIAVAITVARRRRPSPAVAVGSSFEGPREGAERERAALR